MNELDNYIVHKFINEVMCRRASNQVKAVHIWDELKYRYSSETRTGFEIEWNHYKLGELTAEQFAQYINILK